MGKTNDAAIKAARRRLCRKADRGRRRDLPVPKSQQPGPAQLSNPVEQQARRAPGHGRSGDYRPTDQSYAVFKELSDRLDKQFGQLDTLFSVDLPAFNKLLARKKLEPVKDSLPPEK